MDYLEKVVSTSIRVIRIEVNNSDVGRTHNG